MLDPDKLANSLAPIVDKKPIYIAYSGGVDSHVLLHLLSQTQFRESLTAVHIHHGLNSTADEWQMHCRDTTTSLNIPIKTQRINIQDINELGLEAAAREARYKALSDIVPEGAVLLTAQHQLDQAETLLLQLFRGAGPHGLAAMGKESILYGMQVVRPLLNVTRVEIESYAKTNQLIWVEDESNADTQINRNYLRHLLWPVIEKRWPSAAQTLSRSAEHCFEAAQLINELAQLDAEKCFEENKIDLTYLEKLSLPRQKNLIRFVIQQLDLSLPSSAVLEKVLQDACYSNEDTQPLVQWADVEVRRFKKQLYILKHNAGSDIQIWKKPVHRPERLALPTEKYLDWKKRPGVGITHAVFENNLTLHFRQGGERIKLKGHQHHKTLKHLMQEWEIPPWLRNQIPLLSDESGLIAIVGYGIADRVVAKKGEDAWLPVITGT